MNALLEKNLVFIKELSKKHAVKQLFIFGSATRSDFQDSSDVDFLVEYSNFDSNHFVDNYFDFKFALEDLLNRKVDLLEIDSIQNPFLLNNINQEKVLVYEA
jgi:uncharacterized protein